jgi:hypothetical protein
VEVAVELHLVICKTLHPAEVVLLIKVTPVVTVQIISSVAVAVEPAQLVLPDRQLQTAALASHHQLPEAR